MACRLPTTERVYSAFHFISALGLVIFSTMGTKLGERGRGSRGAVMAILATLVVGGGTACNPVRFFACKDEMESSQAIIKKMNDQEIDDVQQSLTAVQGLITVCDGIAPDDEFSKMKDAEQRLKTQLQGLKARQNRPVERPKLSQAELAKLTSEGDPDCPSGQRYEHPQNKQMIRCTGPQLIEMTWQDVLGHFVEKRNFTAHPQGGNLRVERGAEVFDFLYEQEKSDKPPQCVTVVGLPGIAWQELVARATGVQPRRMKLGKPISTSSRGQLPLLIEGDDQQFTVKIGACRATPGQNPYEGAKP